MAAAHAPGGEGASSCSEDGALEDEDGDEDSDEEDGDGDGDHGDGDGGGDGGGGSDGESSVVPIVRATRSRAGSRR